eukprot:m.81764 g.81764  ORF g.81764 m.81764 type:complete len:58 (+) comp13375_c0_seq2:5353-5526(+)
MAAVSSIVVVLHFLSLFQSLDFFLFFLCAVPSLPVVLCPFLFIRFDPLSSSLKLSAC